MFNARFCVHGLGRGLCGVAAAIFLAAGSCTVGGSALAQDLVMTNVRVLTGLVGEGAQIDNATLVVRGGKIVSVRANGQVPEGMMAIDGSAKTIIPGLVDTHSHIGGIGGADASGPIQPDVRISDSINPLDSGFRRAVAGGLTTLNVMPGSGHLLSGQTSYLKLRRNVGAGGGAAGDGAKAGESQPFAKVEDLLIRDASGVAMGGIKMANGTNPMREPPFAATRGKAAALVRAQWIRAQEYQAKLKRAKESGKAEDMPARDIGLEAMVEALEGKKIVHHHTHRADDIVSVLRMQEEFGFRVVLHHVSEAWKVPGEIKKALNPDSTGKPTGAKGGAKGGVLGCSVILVDSPGGKLEAVGLRYETASILVASGVPTCLHTDDWITDSRLFLRMGALAVRAGLSQQDALAALTIRGAEMLDLADRVGSIEAGKDADFVVLSGDPFSIYTKVEQTFVEGVKVFDRSVEGDRLHAVGGFGAGRDQEPYFCCFGAGEFVFGGQKYMMNK